VINEALQSLRSNSKLMMQAVSNHLGDAVNERRSNNWEEVMKSGKWRKVETLHYELELAMLVAFVHSHDGAEVMKIGN
jgi:hypothetical protein